LLQWGRQDLGLTSRRSSLVDEASSTGWFSSLRLLAPKHLGTSPDRGYAVHCHVRLARILVFALALSSIVASFPESALAAPSSRFGVDEGYAAPSYFNTSGAGWDRVNIHWDSMQPTSSDDWFPPTNVSDAVIASDQAAGATVVGVVTNPPAWATRNGSTPANLSLPISDPTNYWAQYITRLATTYAGRIDSWIIWNEPDIDPGRPGTTWAGSENEFYLLMKTAS